MKIISYLVAFIALMIILIIGVMYIFKVCPPQGPWIMPPWCEHIVFERPVYDISVETKETSFVKAINMSDTWGRNYNFNMIESTRSNIDTSFDRVRELGAEEVYVHDFHRAVYKGDWDFESLDYSIVDEIFSNDFRDESMSEKDIKKLTKTAHDREMKLGIKHNMAFVNIGKYIKEGLTGNIESSVAEDFEQFNSGHTEDWIRDYFVKWEARLIEKAKMYESHGVDIMSITPSWMGPTFTGHEELANDLQKQLIEKLRKVFSGKLHIELNLWGVIDGDIEGSENWNKYDYYKLADIKEVRVYNLIDRFAVAENPDVGQMTRGLNKLLDHFEKYAKNNEFSFSIFFSPFSYSNAINEGIVEFHDIRNEKTKSMEKDWDHQADAWQAFLSAVSEREYIERVVINTMWWDNAMDPNVKVRISISPSIRNKPAEEVIRQWFVK